ncbi:MAG: cyclic nucleotide-binding domain-containing protein [Vicinamibacteria bacterium]
MRFELLPPVPAVTLVRRLREIPLFRFASMDELFRIATISRQVRYAGDSRVQERGLPAEYIQVLLEGRFRVENGRKEESDLISPPAMLGFQEVLKGTPIQDSAVAETESVVLVMPAEEFRTLLAANIELAQGLFRMLLSPTGNDSGPAVPTLEGRPFRYENRDAPLKTVEKVMYLQTVPILSHANAEEIYEVAAISREIVLSPNETLFSPGSPAAMLLLLSGEVELTSAEGETRTARAGASLGLHETLAGSGFSHTGRVLRAGKALQIEREPLFDLLADRMDLLQGIFGAVFHSKGSSPAGAR